MTKSELINALSMRENLTEKDATEIVNSIFDGFTEALKNGGKVEVRGFGSFSVRKYKAYIGRNPKNSTNVAVKPKNLSFFKVGKELKNRVDGKLM